MPRELLSAISSSGVPLKSFGIEVVPVDTAGSSTLAALNPERPFLMASTTKLVTSLAALDLLGATHRWQTQAYATGPVVNGRLSGDLVIAADGAGLTPAELARWFKQMRGEGLTEVSGRIVLQRLALLHEDPAGNEEARADTPPDAASFNRGALAVTVQPTTGARATVTVRPSPLDLQVVDDVFMGGGCSAWAQWRQGPRDAAPQLWVRGRWDASCGRRDIALMRPPAALKLAPRPALLASGWSNSRLVAKLWTDSGGRLGHGVVETQRPLRRPDDLRLLEGWTSQLDTPLPDVIREMNKTSNNLSARHLLLALSTGGDAAGAALRSAQDRVHGWLQAQGLADDDIHIDIGSGQSRLERGKPRAMAQLLSKAWRGSAAKALLDSLPIAGVDGTLAQRMRHGAATGHAYLKTGTLHDARALAGYVRAQSGKVYAVAVMVNHPQAARALPALDKLIDWIARNG